MEHKEAANILINMLKKAKLQSDEEEALGIAIGVLSWTQLAQSKIKGMKLKQNKPNVKNNFK